MKNIKNDCDQAIPAEQARGERSYARRAAVGSEEIADCDLFIISGEASGDQHGALLIDSILKISPDIKISGVCGPAMRKRAASCFMHMEELAVMGFTDVIKSLPQIYKSFKKVRNYILEVSPRIVVFIDYQDFNMKMAKSLRKRGFKGKLVQYVCPSIWAWRKGRIKTLTSTLDLLLTVFPFEAKYFEHTDLEVKYIGNPVAEAVKNHKYSKKLNFSSKELIGIFPGSRHQEIELNLPLILKTAEIYLRENKSAQFALSIANNSIKKRVHDLILETKLKLNENVFLVPQENNYDIMKNCHSAIATFGTINLELAMHSTPTVAVYKMSKLNFFIAKNIFRIRLPYFCITNICAEREVFPELLQDDFNSKSAFEALQKLKDEKEECKNKCQELSNSLIVEDGIKRAAEYILK